MDLSLEVIALALAAAVLHAGWNALAKSILDKRRMYLVSNLAAGALGAAAIPFLPLPARESWIILAIASQLQVAYMIVLFGAYRVGDLNLIYPTIRGLTPPLIALGAIVFAGEELSGRQYLGIAIVSAGILSLSYAGGRSRADWRLLGFCALGAVMVSSYTVLDALGVRRSGSPFAYAAWLYVLYALGGVATYPFLRRWRVPEAPLQIARSVVVGFGLAVTYGMIVYALSLGAMAPIAALRETSIIIVALIGTLALGEPFGRNRIVAAAIVTAGLLVLTSPFS